VLAVVCEARKRGQSSFGKLAHYLQFGSGRSLKVSDETGEVIERGQMYYSEAILSARYADVEMQAVARQNTRVKDAIFHYVLAWQEGEEPAVEQWQAAVKRTQEAMGMADHQYVAALHRDATTWHVHVMSNRVHPDTYGCADLWKCHERLDIAIREIENLQGWKASRGLARWQDGRAVLLTKDEKKRQRLTRAGWQEAPQGPAAQMEHWRDEESFSAWVKGAPAQALNALMKRERVSWQDVHAELARFGLTLRHCGDSTTAMGGSASPGDRTTDIGSRDSGAASRLSVAHRVLERCAAFSARRFAGGSR